MAHCAVWRGLKPRLNRLRLLLDCLYYDHPTLARRDNHIGQHITPTCEQAIDTENADARATPARQRQARAARCGYDRQPYTDRTAAAYRMTRPDTPVRTHPHTAAPEVRE